jgi:putative transposase
MLRSANASLHLQRQREDFARKTASALISSHDLIALEDLKARNLVRNQRLAKAISDVGWARLRRWVERYGQLQGALVMAIPPEYTSQDCSGVPPDGSPCPARIRKSLSVRTHICPRCGLLFDRDENAAVNILARGLALAREQGLRPQDTGEPTVLRGSVGRTGT